ncbi:MAG: isoprenoid biosynthesis glyoxalase ElbB [Desulfatitalea sp.]|nr:isoprenoid biosynthesis glyoxalase ElbB [Desulfatitalea sp.]NNJ99454.1 isoprenoid biosynthesis glyoxalase ElbB [Desulfatitalea sp.]
MRKRIGVLLSGCGVFDGSEIHEAVLTLLFLDQAGAEVVCMAPDEDQLHVIDHTDQSEMDGARNVLKESARIARGNMVDLATVTARQLDALIIPGGMGAAKNLSTFAVKGPQAEVHPQVQRIIEEMIAARKPVGALCIAPATLAKALAAHKPEVTIGTEVGTAAAIETMGAKHVACNVDQIHVDTALRIVTTPAYMLGPGIKDVAVGIEKLVRQVLEMA